MAHGPQPSGASGGGGGVCYARTAVAPLVLLTERSLPDVLPTLAATGHDVKVEPLSADARHVQDLSALAILIDGAQPPERALEVARAARAWRPPVALVLIARRDDLNRFPWADVADDLLVTDASAAEIRLR